MFIHVPEKRGMLGLLEYGSCVGNGNWNRKVIDDSKTWVLALNEQNSDQRVRGVPTVYPWYITSFTRDQGNLTLLLMHVLKKSGKRHRDSSRRVE